MPNRSMRIPAVLTCALMLIAAHAVGADELAPATVAQTDGKVLDKVFVIIETLDGVKFKMDKDSQSEMTLKRAQIKAIDYHDSPDPEFAKAKGSYDRREWDKAAAAYVAAASSKGVSYSWVREKSYMTAAEAFLEAKKYDEAVEALAGLEKLAPLSIYMPRATYLRFTLESARGKRPEAEAALKKLKDKGAEWGVESQVLAADGLAQLHRADKKPAEAAAVLAGLLETLDPAARGGDYARLAFQMAADLTAAGDAAKANAVYQKLTFAPVGGAAQAQAHLALAKALSAKDTRPELIVAFDHAVAAAALRGAEPRVGAEAKGVIRNTILPKFDKEAKADKAFEKDVVEYRNYLSSLR